jgi:hypothetical protein
MSFPSDVDRKPSVSSLLSNDTRTAEGRTYLKLAKSRSITVRNGKVPPYTIHLYPNTRFMRFVLGMTRNCPVCPWQAYPMECVWNKNGTWNLSAYPDVGRPSCVAVVTGLPWYIAMMGNRFD